MKIIRTIAALLTCALIGVAGVPTSAHAQHLTFATVERAPFSMLSDAENDGFSIDSIRAIADKLGREIQFETVDTFAEMFDLVEAGQVDGAIANISITAAREERFDFTQPIFEAGIKILVRASDGSVSMLDTLLRWDLLIAILIAVVMLFGGGLLMWIFEKDKQPYFDRPAREAIFPSFWWALNLVVNGGFEERVPQSRPGKVFAVLLVISSLFLVSVFVAKITASVTIEALQETVGTINDLEGRRVGTIDQSTAARLLANRDLEHRGYPNPDTMFSAFENGDLDALVFDAPILAYYAASQKPGEVRLLERNYRPENYGIALPTGSPLKEQIDQALLGIREDGTYDALIDTWFGAGYSR